MCLAIDGELEIIFNIEKSLISTINDHLFEVRNLFLKKTKTLYFVLQLKDVSGWPTGICVDCKSKLVITRNFFTECRSTQQDLLDQFGDPSSPLNSTLFDDSFTMSDDDCFDDKTDNTSANESFLEEIIPLGELRKSLKSKADNNLLFNFDDKTGDTSDNESFLEEIIPLGELKKILISKPANKLPQRSRPKKNVKKDNEMKVTSFKLKNPNVLKCIKCRKRLKTKQSLALDGTKHSTEERQPFFKC